MKKLIVKNDYVFCKFYKFGKDDTFDYFYYRNNSIFEKNKFHESVSIVGYNDEKYPKIEEVLSSKNIIKNDSFMLPKGIYELKEYIEYGNKCWEVNIDDVILNIVDQLDESHWNYKKTRKEYLEIK